ncbi:WbqC-like protein [Luteibacter rhizovicinus]|uniref:WbqC-like protein n=1 Tax=Luteibacter rhizovicinus TaxID=242606 RepID=A0A4R3YUR3_9GAMM|nr:WbqC family protein [Luteibacter rhizovicinus]TCV94953.1 WbqC-like protein [Luteibacter rhizovicinus]
MKVAIMQPYFFPYIGYFQLMHAVEKFVIYDDAQYMKGGWINRNRILHTGAPLWWSAPVTHDSLKLPINRRTYSPGKEHRDRLIRQLDAAYRTAPHFHSVRDLVVECLSFNSINVATFNTNLLTTLARALDLPCQLLLSSDISASATTGEERVLDICESLGATIYINTPGGRKLYSHEHFLSRHIRLCFLCPEVPAYTQLGHPPIPGLSIVDCLMFNGLKKTRTLTSQYTVENAHHE